jgi:hydrogenase maturation protein HypF
VDKGSRVSLRRGRGYAPYSVGLSFEARSTLAVGSELRNTFCLARDRYAFLSHHIGDMGNLETHECFEQGIHHLSHVLRFQPELIAHDLHPNTFTTQYAQRLNVQCVGVQHHHAHIVSCMVDNGLDETRLIGLSFDGAGYGADGMLWGGEVLLASFADAERFAHLEYLPLPGGDSAIPAPWRIAASYAHSLGIGVDDLPFLQNMDKASLRSLRQQIDRQNDSTFTSSMGRLFEAVASLIGVRNEDTYEAQAAVEMEALSKPFIALAEPYPFELDETAGGTILRVKGLLSAAVRDVRARESVGIMAARFHKTVAVLAIQICSQARQSSGLNEVALSGGVWQNCVLLDLVRDGLKEHGFVVYSHRQVPTDDGGLSLGQAVIANHVAARRPSPEGMEAIPA